MQLTTAQKYAQSPKGKAMRKAMRKRSGYKQLQKEWRERGGAAAEYQRIKSAWQY